MPLKEQLTCPCLSQSQVIDFSEKKWKEVLCVLLRIGSIVWPIVRGVSAEPPPSLLLSRLSYHTGSTQAVDFFVVFPSRTHTRTLCFDRGISIKTHLIWTALEIFNRNCRRKILKKRWKKYEIYLITIFTERTWNTEVTRWNLLFASPYNSDIKLLSLSLDYY